MKEAEKAGLTKEDRDQLSFVVSWKGEGIKRLRRAWQTARVTAGLDTEVTPHVLRHTFASWAIQDGHSLEKIAAALGTTVQMIEKTYAAHVAKRLRDVVETVSGAQSGARRRERLEITPPKGDVVLKDQWWAVTGSNRRPSRCKRDALPTELTALRCL